MIKIRKIMKPRKLAKAGVAKTGIHCIEYDSDPEKYRSGQKKLKVDQTIYGNICVKET